MLEENITQQNIENKIESNWKKSLCTVTPLSKYLAMTLFIVLPFLGFWGGRLFEQALTLQSDGPCESCESRLWQCERDKKVIPEKTVETVENPLTMYSDSETGVSFSYPADWGEITVDDERGECDETMEDPCLMRTYRFDDLVEVGTFLVLETRGHEEHPIGRGAFWGDDIGAITKTYKDECTTEKQCVLFTNDKGVTFAKYAVESMYWETEDAPQEIMYDTYSNAGAYYAIRLSPVNLKSVGEPIEKKFEETVIASFQVSAH